MAIPEWVCKRAGGRRRYNKQRQIAAAERRQIVAAIWFERGCSRAQIARELGVSAATVSRDVAAIQAMFRGLSKWRGWVAQAEAER